MDLDIFIGVNWEAPSKQNLVDLYVTRMDLISYGAGYYVDNGYEPSPFIVDDARSAIMSFTSLTVEKYDARIEEAIHILSEDGIPELFLSDAYWDSWSVTYEPTDSDRETAYDIVYDLYYRYLAKSKETSKKFFEIVNTRS